MLILGLDGFKSDFKQGSGRLAPWGS